jgi:uncharacterized protein
MSWKELVVPDQFDEDIHPFWDGLKEHKFLLYRCKRCGACYWPMALCREHQDIPRIDEMEWVPTSGKGKVFTWVIVHQVLNPALKDDLPYALAMVEMDEGPLVSTRIVGCEARDVHVGMPVEVQYEDVEATGMTLPLFRPIGTS